MPIGMRRQIEVTLHVPTPTASLVEVGSGNSAAGNVAVDKFEGDGTGYSNFYTDYTIKGEFLPGVAKKFDLQMMGYRFLGEHTMKFDTKYADLLDSGSHLTIGSADWNYSRLSTLGAGLGNDRIVLVLNRRASA